MLCDPLKVPWCGWVLSSPSLSVKAASSSPAYGVATATTSPLISPALPKALRLLPLTFKGELSLEICRLMKPFLSVAVTRCGVTMRETLAQGVALSRQPLNIGSPLSQWWAVLCLLTLLVTSVRVAAYLVTRLVYGGNQVVALATGLASGCSLHLVRFVWTMVLLTKVTAVSTLVLENDSKKVEGLKVC